jgi:hypothetical protein
MLAKIAGIGDEGRNMRRNMTEVFKPIRENDPIRAFGKCGTFILLMWIDWSKVFAHLERDYRLWPSVDVT